MMPPFVEVIAATLIVLGSAILCVAAIGVVRLPDPFMRMHAATKAGVVGAGLLMLGAGVSFGTVGGLVTGLAGLAFLLLTSPIASHVLGRAAYVAGAPLAPATVENALQGILPRNVFDIAPSRSVRRPSASPSQSQESAMAPVPFPSPQTAATPEAAALRHLTVWLVGGEAQRAASQVALDLARATGARVTGLTALDPAAVDEAGPFPAGGAYWARWLAAQRRTRMRDAAADALAAFESVASEAGLAPGRRHEEGDFESVAAAMASTDLVVVPAGVDRAGRSAAPHDEVSALLSRRHLAPVVRVNRRPLAVRRVALLVDNDPAFARLAQAYLRTGLWAGARVAVLPIGEHRGFVEKLVGEQVALLRAHGRDAVAGDPFDLDISLEDATDRLRPYDAVVSACLCRRVGWFGAVREDVHEIAAETASVFLLP